MIYYQGLNIWVPFIGLAVNIFIQISAFRFFPKTGLLRSVFLGFTVGCLVIIVLGFGAKIIFNLFVYFLLGYCYFHFINMGQTARRIRILSELKDCPSGLSMPEILERYNSAEIIQRRLSRLIEHGQVLFKNGKYYIKSPFLLLVAKFLITLKRGLFPR